MNRRSRVQTSHRQPRTLAAIQFMFEIHWSLERLHLVQCSVKNGVMSEWLRGQSGMLMGSARVGSNPTVTVNVNVIVHLMFKYCSF